MSRESNSTEWRSGVDQFLQACVDQGILTPEMTDFSGHGFNHPQSGLFEALRALSRRESDVFRFHLLDTPLNDEQRFASFVACEANVFPVEIARKVALGSAGSLYNPFFIASDPGLGKTHLLNAIAQQAPEGHALLVNLADLDAEVERAVRLACRAELRERLCATRILILDDVQLCSEKPALQGELLAILNRSFRLNHSVVLGADVAPPDIAGIDEKLASIFGSGVVVVLEMCGSKERAQILERDLGVSDLDPDVVDYLSLHVTDSVRQLKGIAKQLIALSDGFLAPITLEMARAVVPLPDDIQRCYALEPPLKPRGVTAVAERRRVETEPSGADPNTVAEADVVANDDLPPPMDLSEDSGTDLTRGIEIDEQLVSEEEPSVVEPLFSPAAPAGPERDEDSKVHLIEDKASLFKEMLASAENEEEQALALQIALGERLRELREIDGDPESIEKLEQALNLIRDGKIQEAMAHTQL